MKGVFMAREVLSGPISSKGRHVAVMIDLLRSGLYAVTEKKSDKSKKTVEEADEVSILKYFRDLPDEIGEVPPWAEH